MLLISEFGFCRPEDMQLFVWRFQHELGWGAQRKVSRFAPDEKAL